jgi:hypothetical protein
MRILMIHGRAQGGKDRERLRREWLDALALGFRAAGRDWPEDVEFDFPYYGDDLDRMVAAKPVLRRQPGAATRRRSVSDYDRFLSTAIDELRRGAGITRTEIRAASGGSSPQRLGPQNWWWVRAAARAIDRRLTPVADFSIETFLRDVYLYLRDAQVRAAIDAIVEAEMREAPTLVLAHSLGSVIGYHLVRRHAAAGRLTGFVTVGSPLGLRAIATRLPAIENPVGEEGWFNAYDRRDIVALNPLDGRHFPAAPPIVNHGAVDNRTGNRHGIVGYLDDPQVAARIADGIAQMRALG